MNILLWILQTALAVFCFAGGAYKIFKSENVVRMSVNSFLPRAAWQAVGVFEIICAVLLVLPLAIHWMPLLTPASATAIAVEDLAFAAMYGRRSLRLTFTNPFVYVTVGAVLAAVVAWGRYALLLLPLPRT